MTITLPLDAELAGLLTEKAATQGVKVEQLALDPSPDAHACVTAELRQ
jgi:hypothetical protein